MQVFCKASELATPPQKVKVSSKPAIGFPLTVRTNKLSEHAFGAFEIAIVFGGQLIRAFSRIEAKFTPQLLKRFLFSWVDWIESGENPTFAFGVGKPDDNWHADFRGASSLLQPFAAFRLAIVVANQNDGICGARTGSEEKQGTSSGMRIGSTGQAAKVSVSFEVLALTKSAASRHVR